MHLHEVDDFRKSSPSADCGKPVDRLPDNDPDIDGAPRSARNVSRTRSPTKQDIFENLRLRTDRRTWRFSPDIPGLWTIKAIVLGAYRVQMISGLSAQRVVDRLRLLEA